MENEIKIKFSLLKYGKYGIEGQLYDSLSSGCKLVFAEHSLDYSDEVKSDIKYLVRCEPEFLKFNDGHIRCRYKVTPLAIACFNVNIPLDIIDFLLENGANPYEKIELN